MVARSWASRSFALVVGIAFAIQWLVFVPSYLLRNEHFYDLTGSITYISVAILAVLLSPKADGRTILLLVLVVIWAVRLGSFLFRRIRKAGKDERFDERKTSFPRFLRTGTLQGLWVSLTLAAALAAITSTTRKGLDVFALISFLVWALGFALEVIADTQWVTLISPVFVTLLLTRVSGVPMLEKRADEKWGGQEDYEAYKERTPVLIPRPQRPYRGEWSPWVGTGAHPYECGFLLVCAL